MPLPPTLRTDLARAVGDPHVLDASQELDAYGADALKRVSRPDLVVRPGTAGEVSAVVRLCSAAGVPMVPRGAGTGYTGGSVPIHGGVVISLERMNRILEIDEENLLAVVQPNVITADLQAAVERVGLFYPPDPASLNESAIGGNVAECAGGPRAFKYGTTRNYVLALEAVLPTGEIIRTGSKAVKNVVGYDLTRLLVGSEGTLAIITQIVLRLVPKPPARRTLRATFGTVSGAAGAVSGLLRARVVPASLELLDGDSLAAVTAYLGRPLAPEGTSALLLIEVDGLEAAVAEESARVEAACRQAGATEVLLARDETERDAIWEVRRELSSSLRAQGRLKINNDVVVPRGRVPALFALLEDLKTRHGVRIASFGHAGDGNVHVNILVDPGNQAELARARTAERELFEGVVGLEGSLSGEHGIGFTKVPFLAIELGADEIALMARVKRAFDPRGLLNPGKIFPGPEAGDPRTKTV